MSINIEQLQTMTEDLFVDMLGMDIKPIEKDQQQPLEPDSLVAAVQISGAWNAELRVNAPQDMSESIACAMFAVETEELTEEETLDALGEIANVIGGNIKGVIDRDCDLSLPCVGNVDEMQVPDGALVEAYQCGQSSFEVVFIQH